jgi:hypothetical protein
MLVCTESLDTLILQGPGSGRSLWLARSCNERDSIPLERRVESPADSTADMCITNVTVETVIFSRLRLLISAPSILFFHSFSILHSNSFFFFIHFFLHTFFILFFHFFTFFLFLSLLHTSFHSFPLRFSFFQSLFLRSYFNFYSFSFLFFLHTLFFIFSQLLLFFQSFLSFLQNFFLSFLHTSWLKFIRFQHHLYSVRWSCLRGLAPFRDSRTYGGNTPRILNFSTRLHWVVNFTLSPKYHVSTRNRE